MQIKALYYPIVEDIEAIQKEFGYSQNGVDESGQLIFSNNLCSDTEDISNDQDSVLSFLIKYRVTNLKPPISSGLGAIILPEEIGEKKNKLKYVNDDNSQDAKDKKNFYFSSIHTNHFNLHLTDLDQKTLLIQKISQEKVNRIRHFSSQEICNDLLGVVRRPDWDKLLKDKPKWKKPIRIALREYLDKWKVKELDEKSLKSFSEESLEEKEQMSKNLSLYIEMGGEVKPKQIDYIKNHIDKNF
ncbi:hypothetical protein OAT67_07175 [Bacteriovoracaceae bacterium]|nr:hypothetical protein [Bacteriovoracaceae bacterium]